VESSQVTISSIVFIVSLIVPGIIFKKFYYQGQFTKQFGAGPFADRLISSIFWGIFVQILTFLIFTRYLGIKYDDIKKKIDTVYASIVDNKIPNITYSQLLYILSYLAFLVFVAAVIGSFLHLFIRYFKLDIRFNVLRFSNKWNYLIRGDILLTREFKGRKKGAIDSTMVDIIIDDATEKNKMISGFLTDYTISEKTGELESIHLTAAKRYSQTDKAFKEILGDCLIVPCHRMVNMNLRYIIKVVDKNAQKKLIFFRAVFILLFVGWLTISLLIFNTRSGVIFKVFGLPFMLFGWMLFIISLSNPFHPNPDVKLSRRNSTITALIGLLSFLIAFLFLIL
jgi:hypothetical protein